MKSIRVLFLDFDGVLNSSQYFYENYGRLDGRSIAAYDQRQLDPAAIARLNRVVEATSALIVVTSAWRIAMGKTPRSALRGLLAERGFVGQVLDVTPNLRNGMDGRHLEILKWANDAQEERDFDITSYAIVDDNYEAGLGNAPYFVCTEFATGLQDEHADKLIEILSNDRHGSAS